MWRSTLRKHLLSIPSIVIEDIENIPYAKQETVVEITEKKVESKNKLF